MPHPIFGCASFPQLHVDLNPLLYIVKLQVNTLHCLFFLPLPFLFLLYRMNTRLSHTARARLECTSRMLGREERKVQGIFFSRLSLIRRLNIHFESVRYVI